MSSLIAVFLVAENAEVLAGFPVRPALVLRGMLYDRDQGRSVWQARIGAPSSLARSFRMIARKAPVNTIGVDGQAVTGRDIPSEHMAAPAAFQANDIIAMNGSPDRDG